MTATQKKLEVIAHFALGIPTLKTQNDDRLDFTEVAVWQVQKALELAYEIGQCDSALCKPQVWLISEDEQQFLRSAEGFKEAVACGAIVPSDGYGVWATKTVQSHIDAFTPQPKWATHVLWFNN